MLELRPNCEWCDRDLPPASPDARICSYECTYCVNCVETVLRNVCPTCGGNFAARPIRPQRAYRENPKLGLQHQPAGSVRKNSKYSADDVADFVSKLHNVSPDQR
ncbi:MAG: DUF1272 domain-containing protein [Rhizobiaceae bacterium]|nr:DUF1272 domain-containing protein [Rhizobiaceae bacterium]